MNEDVWFASVLVMLIAIMVGMWLIETERKQPTRAVCMVECRVDGWQYRPLTYGGECWCDVHEGRPLTAEGE